MARAGRKRKESAREPNGRLDRIAAKQAEGPSPAQVRRLRDAALSGMRDPEWGSEIGRLFLAGRIDPVQYAAAKRYRSLHDAWCRTSGLPKPHPKGQSLDGAKGAAVDPDSEQGQREAERTLGIMAALSDARTSVLATGTLPWLTLKATLEQDKLCVGLDEVRWLCKGLDALGDHWKLTA